MCRQLILSLNPQRVQETLMPLLVRISMVLIKSSLRLPLADVTGLCR